MRKRSDRKSRKKISRFYDWRKTFSYNADVTMVIGARGVGKTYGLRKKAVENWDNRQERFVEIVRHKNELDGDDSIIEGYFDKLIENDEFPDLLFKTSKHIGYVARKPESDQDMPEWDILVYFCALTDQQLLKKKTFSRVTLAIFDEAILDRTDRWHNYLSYEYDKVTNLVSTITRQLAFENNKAFHLYLLGNACDLMNPYFQANGIRTEPKFGYSWHNGKTFLLHYYQDTEYASAMLENTVAGRMARGRAEAETMAGNAFANAHDDFIEEKTSSAKFEFGLSFEGNEIGIWIDWNEGLYYINDKIPRNTNLPVFTLTTRDNRINYIAAERCNPYLQSILRSYYLALLRYDTQATRETFARILRLLGIR